MKDSHCINPLKNSTKLPILYLKKSERQKSPKVPLKTQEFRNQNKIYDLATLHGGPVRGLLCINVRSILESTTTHSNYNHSGMQTARTAIKNSL